MIEINREELKTNIIEWATDNIGLNFEFREHQFEQIYNICLNILEGVNHTQIIEAPTGSGKSLLNIISAGVLADCYGKESYILVSDLYLWKQYEDFINKHLPIKRKFGILKGQTGNYTCLRNDEDMRNSDCRIAGISWAKLFNPASAKQLGYDCANTCKYIKERKKALTSKVVVMTYQLYHYMINVVRTSGPKVVFEKRDTIFCDECHNIPSIVTSCFTPQVRIGDMTYFKTLHSYKGKIELDLFDDTPNDPNNLDNDDYELICRKFSLVELEDRFDNIYNVLVDPNAGTHKNFLAIKEYTKLLSEFAETVEAIESNLSHKKQVLGQSFTMTDIQYYKACSWYRNCCCLWNDFNTAINEIGEEYVIKNVAEQRISHETIITFTCVKEDYVVWKFLLGTSENRVMMSATVGGFEAFCENIGIKYLEQTFTEGEEIVFTQMPSTFDFAKSPIYFLNRYKMSYNEKEHSFKQLKPIIYKICNTQFVGKRGMIQTGSYANAKELYDNAPVELRRRMLLYNNAKEKTTQITIHQMSKDTILIGPTLVEGIDLPGEQCRFIIILKVPYPTIVDDYVKNKIKLFPMWYNSITSNTIIQGIGRGVRSQDDYCVTYILDACFLSLYNSTKTQYPEELQKRIHIYT